MMVPALFVAAAAKARAGDAPRAEYDVHILAAAGEFDDNHRRWMATRGIHATSAPDLENLGEVWKGGGRLTPATLARLVMPQVLAARYDRVLYLDADIEVCGPLAPLFALDLEGHVLAAVPAARGGMRLSPEQWEDRHAHFRALGMTEPFRYFNAGVMLIDVARWIERQIGPRALDYVRANRGLVKLADEDALNALLDGDIQDVSPIWNLRTWDFELPRVTDMVQPSIRHYDGEHKPWKRFARGRRLFDLEQPNRRYRAFVSGTPWQAWLDQQWNRHDLFANLRDEGRVWVKHIQAGRAGVRKRRKRMQRRVDAYRDYLDAARFADVEQGIAVRRDGRLMVP